jgi:hypothetical protein
VKEKGKKMLDENLPLILEVRDEKTHERLGEVAVHDPKIGDEVYTKYGKGVVDEFTEAREEGFTLAGQSKALRVTKGLAVKRTLAAVN